MRLTLQEEHPYDLLCFTSTLLAAVDTRGSDPFSPAPGGPPSGPTLADLTTSFIEVPCRETTALLAVLAEMADEELVARRARRELATRRDRMPTWLERLAPVTVDRAMVMSHVLGDGDNIMVAAQTGSGHALTLVVYIDHNLGTVVKDGFVIPEPLDRAVSSFRTAAQSNPDVTFRDLGLADARVRITEAIELGAITFPPYETETWPSVRPLVEWIVRRLPPGGTGYQRPEWDERDRERLKDEFFTSDAGRGLGDDDRDLLDSVLWFGCDYGPGDPLRWSPVAVEILLTDWLPRKVVADARFLGRAPELLRRFIRFSHARRGIPPPLTDETLAAVDRWEPTFRQAISSPRPQGPAALLAAMGVLTDDEAISAWPLQDLSIEEMVRARLREAVGDDALEDLGDAPLPDEPLELSGIPDDVGEKVAEVASLIDACCAELLDVEFRTAGRRLLHDIAEAEPDVFRRRASSTTAAAAIVWIALKANRGFSQKPGGLTAKALGEWFGVRNPGQRAPTLLKALGLVSAGTYDVALGTPRYLVGDHRRWIIEMRDRHRPED